MSAERIKILVTGATGSYTLYLRTAPKSLTDISNKGYIGGTVVSRFLARPDASSLDIRAVVRSAEKGEKLKAFGITPIIGSHDDEELMIKAASQVDVVLAMVRRVSWGLLRSHHVFYRRTRIT